MWRTVYQNFVKHHHLRKCQWCREVRCSISNAAEDQSAPPAEIIKAARKRVPKRLSEDKKINILNFFNNCDHVTLKKLVNQKPAFFKNLDPVKVIQTGLSSQRFQDVEHLVNVAGIDPVRLSDIAKQIQALKKAEDTNFGVRFISPAFPVDKIPDVGKVASLNLFQNRLCWVVQDRDRQVTDVGTFVFEANAFYSDTARHHDECLKLLSTVPYADVYLTMLLRPPVKLNRSPQYVISQGIMESLVIALLNLRQTGFIKGFPRPSQLSGQHTDMDVETNDSSAKYDIVQSLYSETEPLLQDTYGATIEDCEAPGQTIYSEPEESLKDGHKLITETGDESELSEKSNVSAYDELLDDQIQHNPLFTDTSVFVVKLQAFQDFYDVTFMNELLECLPLVDLSADFENQKGPLQGVRLSENIIVKIREMAEKEQVARCLLMSDMFCRSLQKSSSFPRAYSSA